MRQLSDLERAIMLAVGMHKGQIDLAGQPYILHPLRVMASPRLGTDEERIVAVLHDVVEDTEETIEEIFEEFGDSVGLAVQAITHEKKEPQRDYLARVCHDPIALKVKREDIYDNIQRMDGIPEMKTRTRLRRKYLKALEIIEELSKCQK